MSDLGEVLGWTFDYVQGISTRGERITSWPTGLGNEPTLQEIANYRSNYEMFLNDKRNVKQQIRAIILNSVGTDIEQLTTNQLRAFMALLLFERGVVGAAGQILHPDNWFRDA